MGIFNWRSLTGAIILGMALGLGCAFLLLQRPKRFSSAEQSNTTTPPESAETELQPTPDPTVAYLTQFDFSESFDGAPEHPQAWRSSERWNVVIHSRDVDTWHQLEPAEAQHDHNCSLPDQTHTVTHYEDALFQCRNHLMTAISAEAYGLLYFTPNYQLDFRHGEAIIRFDLSTARHSTRDWVDIWITPFDEHLIYPLENWLPDLTGEPRNAVHVRLDMSEPNTWHANIIRDFVSTRVEGTEQFWIGYESVLTPDAKRRDTYELRLSQNHIKFGLPNYNLWWIDNPIDPLPFDIGVVQFGHHSYNPAKACNYDGTCGATTWHWDNIILHPATPFTMIPADRRFIDATSAEPLTFLQAAPQNSFLRFAGIGNDLQISFDNGETWAPPTMQAQNLLADEKFKSYWMPIPQGTTTVLTRGTDWWGGTWHTRDFSIWQQ